MMIDESITIVPLFNVIDCAVSSYKHALEMK